MVNENIRGLDKEHVFGEGAEHRIPIRNRDARSPGHRKAGFVAQGIPGFL